jgi:hypothetical protein
MTPGPLVSRTLEILTDIPSLTEVERKVFGPRVEGKNLPVIVFDAKFERRGSKTYTN